jgi:hypothetical protein
MNPRCLHLLGLRRLVENLPEDLAALLEEVGPGLVPEPAQQRRRVDQIGEHQRDQPRAATLAKRRHLVGLRRWRVGGHRGSLIPPEPTLGKLDILLA